MPFAGLATRSVHPTVVLAACLVALLSGCGPSGGPVDPADSRPGVDTRGLTPGHARMVDELAAISREVYRDNVFLGDGELTRLQDRLDGLPDTGFSASRHRLLSRIGVEELKLGRTEQAIAHLREARDLVPGLDDHDRGRAEVTTLFGLGLAHLRLAEDRNCILCHTTDSCILPIRESGVHLDQEPSRAAIEFFEAALSHPDVGRSTAVQARWLLNIAAMTVGEWPDGVPEAWRIGPETFASDQEFPRFTDVAKGAGLDTLNLSGGVVVEDLDGDGLLDVLTSTWDYEGAMHLHRNAGDGSFVDRAREAGLDGQVGGLNIVHADYDNDGDEDVHVLRGAWFGRLGRHPNSLLRNDGGGTFTDVTHEAGLGEIHYPTQAAAWADYDGDGDLDVYVGNEATRSLPFPGQLFRNDGDGTFTDVAGPAGVENLRYAKGVTWGDYDGDGDPDLYVSNFRGANRLYRNDGDGTFTDVAPDLGVDGPEMSFPCWFWDVDNDGILDLYVAAYVEDLGQIASSYLGLPHDEPPGRLYLGDGRGGFEDATEAWGLTRLVTTMGANFGDLDNDGWLDMYLGTGYPSYMALVPNVMYRNRRGLGFADVTTSAGFGHLQKGHGVAFADLDNDGDQDVFEQMGGAYLGDVFHDALFENPGFGHHWLTISLEGTTTNRSAIGARVRADILEDGAPRSVYRHVGSVGSFGSAPRQVHVGLGSADRIERLTVTWPTSGTTQVFDEVAVDRFVRIVEGRDAIEDDPRPRIAFPRPLAPPRSEPGR